MDFIISKFGGIGLDCSASMSGKHNCLQARLRKRQKIVKYVNCLSSKLNIVVNNSVENTVEL